MWIFQFNKHLHVYSLMSLNGHIDKQVNKLNISIFSVQLFNNLI